MHINVCKHCKKVYTSKFVSYACNECKEKDDLQFEQIKEYLMKYPNSNALQIAEALDISAYIIIQYLNEGRLMTSKGNFERIK
ncbi:hypothetical protein [Clostridium sp. Marseille-P299]|uniref:hypothetical protein n=1 Tax=Clostridium sp. Marseille-P299 TaxID=1805477 RepID=UPI0008340024|nr:hypothetical protein [Clostridium sp. Marseille-P299]